MFADVFDVQSFTVLKKEEAISDFLVQSSRVVERFDWTRGFPLALINI